MTTSYDNTLYTINDNGEVVKYIPKCSTDTVSGGINKKISVGCDKAFDEETFITSYYKMHVNNSGGNAWLGIIDKWGNCTNENSKTKNKGYFTPIYSTPLSASGEYDINLVAESFQGLEVGLFSSEFDWQANPKSWTSEDDGGDLANYPNIDESTSSSQLTTTGIVVDITGQTSVTYNISGCEFDCSPETSTVLTYGNASYNIGCSAEVISGSSYPISSSNTCVSAASGCYNSLITLYDFNVPVESGSDDKVFALYDYRECDINNDTIDDQTIMWDSVTHPVSSTNSIILSSSTRNRLILGAFDSSILDYVDPQTGIISGSFETALISGGCDNNKPQISATSEIIGHAFNIEGPIWDGPQPDYDGSLGGKSWDPSGGSMFGTTFHTSRFNLAPKFGKVDSHKQYIINAPPAEKQDSADSRIRITGCYFYGPIKGNVKITTQSNTHLLPIGIISWPRGGPRNGGCSMMQDIVIPWNEYPITMDINTNDDDLIREHNKIRFFIRIKDDANT